MKAKKPLGWWDTGGASRTHTKRCDNQRKKIICLLTNLYGHPDHAKISGLAHAVLNLAASASAMGQEDKAKTLQKRLRRALEQIADGQLSFSQVLSLASAANQQTITAGTDGPAASKDQ